MAYSKDYRQMILDKLDEGYSYRELAEEYQISTTTIQRWKKNIERKVYVYTVYKVDSDRLKADVELYPDAYQIERARRLNCSQRSISRALKRLGIVVDKLKSYSVNLTKPATVILEIVCLVSHLVGYDYITQKKDTASS